MEIRSVGYPTASPNGTQDKPDPKVHAPNMSTAPAGGTATIVAVQPLSRSAEAEQTKQAVQEIERMMKLFSRNVEFSYDNEENRTIMRVVDRETQEVIRQVPTEEALEIAKALKKIQDMLLLQDSRNLLGK